MEESVVNFDISKLSLEGLIKVYENINSFLKYFHFLGEIEFITLFNASNVNAVNNVCSKTLASALDKFVFTAIMV